MAVGEYGRSMNRNDIKLRVLDQLEEMVTEKRNKVGYVMDDYDGGQANAYDNVLTDIKAYKAIINHTASTSSNHTQEEPGIDY